jgi:hypothetical protein
VKSAQAADARGKVVEAITGDDAVGERPGPGGFNLDEFAVDQLLQDVGWKIEIRQGYRRLQATEELPSPLVYQDKTS